MIITTGKSFRWKYHALFIASGITQHRRRGVLGKWLTLQSSAPEKLHFCRLQNNFCAEKGVALKVKLNKILGDP